MQRTTNLETACEVAEKIRELRYLQRWKGEIPNREICTATDGKWKVGVNWFQGIICAIDGLRDLGVLREGTINYYNSYFQHNQPEGRGALTTREQIRIGDRLISHAIRDTKNYIATHLQETLRMHFAHPQKKSA